MQVCKMLIYEILAWPPSTFSFTFCEGFLGLFLFSSSAKQVHGHYKRGYYCKKWQNCNYWILYSQSIKKLWILTLVSTATGVSRLFSYSSACAFVANKNTRVHRSVRWLVSGRRNEFHSCLRPSFPANRAITHDAFTFLTKSSLKSLLICELCWNEWWEKKQIRSFGFQWIPKLKQ